jgi:2-keto-4-pentenoate hydratase/2-oxohepta-3-ene-1,7-dioic acid hydratase in catechol pathway
MRILTYRKGGSDRAGVHTADGILDAAELLGEDSISVRELLAADRIGDLRRAAESGGTAVSENELEPRPPVPDPDKIVCIGLNYRAHAEEAGRESPDLPAIFAKFRNALAAPGADVTLPAASAKVDYEAEVAFVVGRRCKEVDEQQASEAIAGFMLLNDLSARDLQFATPQWMAGKVFDGSAPCGPSLVTPDEAGEHDAISFRLELNGEVMQEADTSDLIFSVPELLSRLSHWMTMEPGDIVSTGTPAGVGSVRDPRVWLKAGDEIVITSPTLGELRTTLRGSD